MKILFKLILAISSISFLPIIFIIKSSYFPSFSFLDGYHLNYFAKNAILFGCLSVPILLSCIVLKMTVFFGKDEIKDVIDIVNSSNDFLPNYLGYFFVALSINDNSFFTLFIICFLLTIFLFVSQSNYFNPAFLVFGYNFYTIKTKNGLSILLITKKDFRKSSDVVIDKVYRVNNFTFIDR